MRDLFYATPARLKFLKSARAEQMQARDALTRLAMAHHHVGFVLRDGQRFILSRTVGTSAAPISVIIGWQRRLQEQRP